MPPGAAEAPGPPGPPGPPGGCEASLRERKKLATRTALRRVAVALVSSRGLAAVTVDDIAAGADVSARTFFNYFSSKEDAVSGMDPAALADMAEQLRARPVAEPSPAALRAVLLGGMSPVSDPHELVERLQLTRSDPHLVAHHVACWAEMERQLVAALAERRGTDATHDHYASLVVATSLTAARVAFMAWCDGEGRIPLVDELARHLDILGTGLVEPPKGRSRR